MTQMTLSVIKNCKLQRLHEFLLQRICLIKTYHARLTLFGHGTSIYQYHATTLAKPFRISYLILFSFKMRCVMYYHPPRVTVSQLSYSMHEGIQSYYLLKAIHVW